MCGINEEVVKSTSKEQSHDSDDDDDDDEFDNVGGMVANGVFSNWCIIIMRPSFVGNKNSRGFALEERR